MISRLAFLLTGLLSLSVPALAASSETIVTPGGSVKLVTSGVSDSDGRLRGALQIALEPGWKTYWRDPGPTGIPPRIELLGQEVKGVEILFPAPRSFADPYGDWAGYDRSVTLPVIFHTPKPGTAPLIESEVMLGICKAICIPVEAPLVFDASAGAEDIQDALTVQAAFADLPSEPRSDFRLSVAEKRGNELLLRVNLPDPEIPAQLFITALGGQMTLPSLTERDATAATFASQVLIAPRHGAHLHYTLVQGDEAVAGTVPFPVQVASGAD